MKTALRVLFLMFVCVCSVFAQNQKMETGSLSVEVSSSVEDISSGVFSKEITMTWKNPGIRNWSFTRQGDHIMFHSPNGYSVFVPKNFAYYYDVGYNLEVLHPKSVESDLVGDVVNGKKWEISYMLPTRPASYCSSNEAKMTAEFQVGEKQVFTLIVDGKQTELSVYPVYERGWWNRCYSGKIVRKFLFSPELNMAVSIETVAYGVSGNVNHGHMIKVKEIKKNNNN